jgi:hypothetical protein
MSDCKWWGENRADTGFIDTGCVLGHCLCSEACEDHKCIIPKNTSEGKTE